MNESSSRPQQLPLDDRDFVGGYLEEMAAHQLAAGPFPPTLQDIQAVNAAAKLLRSETRERWNYGKPPKDEKDCRRLVSIEQDGVQWIGIRAWNHERQCWMDGSGNAPELASVVAWRWLPDPAWLQNSGSGCEKEDYRL
jgi:uncharacterized protein (DUF2236 family)